MSNFRTQVNFSSQIKEYPNTDGTLSGSVNVQQYTILGTDYLDLPLGLDGSTTGITSTFFPTTYGTFTGTTGSTTFFFSDPNMDLGIPYLSALTPSNSGITQNVEVYIPLTTLIVDGNSFDIYYSGVSYDLVASNMYEYTPGEFSGITFTNVLEYISGTTYPWWFLKSGSTTWNEVKGRTQTDRLTVVEGATYGYVLTSDSDGNATWQPPVVSTGSTITPSPYIFGSASLSILPLSGNNTTLSQKSVILGGNDNTVDSNSTYSGIISGQFNDIRDSIGSFIGSGEYNNIDGTNPNRYLKHIILNGYDNNIIDTGVGSYVVGYKTIINGYRNNIQGTNSITESGYETILNGRDNTITDNITSHYSSILNGRDNIMTNGGYGSILNGYSNTITSSENSLIFGRINTITNGATDSIVFGASNYLDYSFGNFISGNSNRIIDTRPGGYNHVIFGSNSVISGICNTTIILGSNITGNTSDTVYVTNLNINGGLTLNNESIESSWTSYLPTWTAASTNPVLNDGTITGSYKLIGKTCFVRGRLTMGTTTTYGSGAWYIGLPFTAASPYGIIIPVTILDNGLNWYSALMNGGRLGSSTVTEIQWQNTTGVAVGITATVPFTWGNLDELEWNGSYEIA